MDQQESIAAEDLERYAGLQYSAREIALILGADPDELERAAANPVDWRTVAMERGRLRVSAEVRHAIYVQAKSGSTPAQKQMMEMVEAASRTNTVRGGKIARDMAALLQTALQENVLRRKDLAEAARNLVREWREYTAAE